MTNARSNSFSSLFERISKEPAEVQNTLTIDDDLTLHVPARVLARYDLHAGVEGYWNLEYGVLTLVFLKKLDTTRVDDIPEKETWPIDGSKLVADYANEIDFGGDLPARFGFVKAPTDVLDRYHGRGDEAVLILLQWRQPGPDS